MNNFQIYLKTMKVINSCETIDHLKVAIKFTNAAIKMISTKLGNTNLLMNTHLLFKLREQSNIIEELIYENKEKDTKTRVKRTNESYYKIKQRDKKNK